MPYIGKYLLLLALFSQFRIFAQQAPIQRISGVKPTNVIFILSDDHRYDFMGFTGKVPGLTTPNMDRMGTRGVHLANTFVTTSLCSPSRASILTGQFSHVHEVIDNQAPAKPDLIYFPQYLQTAGYQTSFFGKWHMGNDSVEPRPGFTHWESFRGQGQYYNPQLNINGVQHQYGDSTYITDLLTDHALEWLQNRKKDQPFFMYLSHKAVHAEFNPSKRHTGKYAKQPIDYPPTMYPPDVDINSYQSVTAPKPTHQQIQKAKGIGYNYALTPDWVKAQRFSWHGVDYMYNGTIEFNDFYRRYLETLLAVDESIGQLLNYLEENKLLDNTVVFYMGDNGFSFGEHGLIDKRQAYEESMRVPLLAIGGGIKSPQKVNALIQNIDIAPPILELAGVKTPSNMQGQSFLPMLRGQQIGQWRDMIFYEYFWERPFPQTPTMHAVRTDRYKFIRYHGIWDTNEFYDLEQDPWEANNLIFSPAHQEIIGKMNTALFDWLEGTNGLKMPLKAERYPRFFGDHRYGNTY